MATKAPAAPQDDFNLDDIKLDDFPMEDNALFADLDNEMRAGGDDLDLSLDEPGEPKFDDTLDLDLSLDDAPAAESAGSGDLDLDLGDGDKGDSGADLDLGEDSKTGDADLKLDGDLDLDLGDGDKSGGGDLNLDEDLNLDLDAPAESADAGGVSADLDLDVGSLDLNLDEGTADAGESLNLDEPGEPSFGMDEPAEPKFDMDLPDEPNLSLDDDTVAEGESEGISLSVVEPEPSEPAAADDDLPPLDLPDSEPELPSLDAAEPEPELPPLDAAEAEPELPPLDTPEPLTADEADLDLALDEGMSLDSIPEAPAEGDDGAAAEEFQAAPDVNLDDIDLSFETSGGDAPGLEPMGAQVNLQESDGSAPTMDAGFDLPPLAETKGDVEHDDAEPFVAVPDVSLTEDEVLELNLPQQDADDAQPEFTMAPDPMDEPAMGRVGGEFRLTEPMARASGSGMRALRSGDVAPGGGAPRPPRAAAVSQDILLSIPHKISVQMGQVNLMGKDVRNLAYGSVVQLNRTVGEPVDLLLDGKSIAQGEIVLINGKNLGVRILALNK